jgi:hypothetical protein
MYNVTLDTSDEYSTSATMFVTSLVALYIYDATSRPIQKLVRVAGRLTRPVPDTFLVSGWPVLPCSACQFVFLGLGRILGQNLWSVHNPWIVAGQKLWPVLAHCIGRVGTDQVFSDEVMEALGFH